MKKFLIACKQVKKIYKTKSKKRLRNMIGLCVVFDAKILNVEMI